MDIQLMIKKGYTLVSMMLCLFIISVMTLLTISKYTTVNKDDLFLFSDFVYYQGLSLTSNSQIDLVSDYLPIGNSIYFYSDGNVNKAKTIEIGNKELVITLGNGYAHFK